MDVSFPQEICQSHDAGSVKRSWQRDHGASGLRNGLLNHEVVYRGIPNAVHDVIIQI